MGLGSRDRAPGPLVTGLLGALGALGSLEDGFKAAQEGPKGAPKAPKATQDTPGCHKRLVIAWWANVVWAHDVDPRAATLRP